LIGQKKVKKVKKGTGDIVIEVLSIVLITLFAIACLFPFIYVFFISFMSYEEYLAHPLRIIPHNFDLTAYRKILDFQLFRSGYLVTLIITLVGTTLSVFLLTISAYPLARKGLKGRKVFMTMILFTMFFNGGMIPNFLLIKGLGIYDTLWALILPGSLSAFYLILMKNFIKMSVPEALEEAAKVDGANDLRILISVVVPLLKPAIATMIIFNAVNYWNNYFNAKLYISNRNRWPLMLVLQELVAQDTTSVSPVTQMLTSEARASPFTLQMVAVVITLLPILMVYPFMQRYFVKGISLGSVKE
jgi:ABC-type sugar transport system, permease component